MEEDRVKLPVHYINHAIVPTKMRYSNIRKLAFALLISSKKLCPYFKVRMTIVTTNYLLQQVLYKLNTSSRLIR